MAVLSSTKIDPAQLKDYDLTYVYEQNPGIQRVKRGRGFSFLSPDGTTIKDKSERERLLAIAVPPTYDKVWYCPIYNGHLQATGFDASAKKQYFYHPAWELLRETSKFSYMERFGEKLPAFRRRINRTLNDADNEKEELLSAMSRILDKTGMRTGNESASQTNKTYGLTTLRKKHVDHDDAALHFEYKGKGGNELEKDLRDPKVVNIIDHCAEIPGQRLFQYLDSKGEKHSVDSSDMNIFLKDSMGEDFSAKDFRTWRFSCLFLEEALRLASKGAGVTLKSVLGRVSETSGNTPSILKSSYVHPGLMKNDKDQLSGLRKSENRLLNYLKTKHASDAFALDTGD